MVEGDALKSEDVQRAFNEASADGPIDFVISTVGEWFTSSRKRNVSPIV